MNAIKLRRHGLALLSNPKIKWMNSSCSLTCSYNNKINNVVCMATAESSCRLRFFTTTTRTMTTMTNNPRRLIVPQETSCRTLWIPMVEERFFSSRSSSSSSSLPLSMNHDESNDVPKTLDELEKILKYNAQQGELQKLETSMDFYYHQYFPHDKLATDTVATIMEAYIRTQQDLLRTLDQYYHHNDSLQELNDNHHQDHLDSNLSSCDIINWKDIQAILNQAWDVTHDLDDLIRKLGAHDVPTSAINSSSKHNLDRKHYEMILQAWDALMKAYDKANGNVQHPKGMPQRATHHLEQLERLASLNSNDRGVHDCFVPTIEMYNIVLNMWSKSQEHFLSQRAESIVRKMGQFLSFVEPNVETYRIMIQIWCRTVNDVVASKNKIGTAAFNATGYLIRMQALMEKGHAEFEPSMEDYTMVFRAWAKAGHAKYSGKRALFLLKKMENLASSDNALTTVRPDVTCYKCVLQSFSQSRAQYVEGLGYETESIIARMEDNGLIPDSDCFTFAIQTWSNSACRNELAEKDIYESASRAHKLLNQKKQMHFRSGTIEVKTSTLDYNNVIRAWSRSSSKDAYQKVEGLLSTMENLYQQGDVDVRPTYETYVHAIHALGMNPNVGMNIHLVQELLLRMKIQHENGNEDCKPNIQCFNAAMRVCGSRNFRNANEDELQNGLRCVVSLVQEIGNAEDVNPNSETYNLALDAFSILIDKKSPTFSRVVSSIFTRCCNEGLVDEKVIKTFHRVAPYDLYRRLVLAAASPDREIDGTPISDVLFLPNEWTRNITTIKQRIPLAVDGRFVRARSKSVSEHKMRRLRRKEKKLMLQGGRS